MQNHNNCFPPSPYLHRLTKSHFFGHFRFTVAKSKTNTVLSRFSKQIFSILIEDF